MACCSVLQFVAVCCSVFTSSQHAVTHCNTPQLYPMWLFSTEDEFSLSPSPTPCFCLSLSLPLSPSPSNSLLLSLLLSLYPCLCLCPCLSISLSFSFCLSLTDFSSLCFSCCPAVRRTFRKTRAASSCPTCLCITDNLRYKTSVTKCTFVAYVSQCVATC